jgi:ABC-type uncharacterized transport system permease subunit
MHEMSIFWLRAAVVLYSIGLLQAILTILRRKTQFFHVALGTFAVATILHMVSLVEAWIVLGHLPADNFFQSVSICAFLISNVFLFVYWRYQFESLGVFLFPLVFLMALVGATEAPVAAWQNQGIRDAWLKIHVLLVLSGYAALLLTAAASIFYLIQERQIKRKSARGFFDRLPPLGTLDNLITQSMGLGFVLITLAVVAGSVWAFIESGASWIGEAKIAISLATWAIYLVMIFLRTSAGWRGRKAALLAITVLGCFVITWAAHIGLRPVLAQ